VLEARWLTENATLTLHDLAAEFGVSAERIRQIEQKAMQKIKALMLQIA
jgi:RNA polymerase sigma-32 factor